LSSSAPENVDDDQDLETIIMMSKQRKRKNESEQTKLTMQEKKNAINANRIVMSGVSKRRAPLNYTQQPFAFLPPSSCYLSFKYEEENKRETHKEGGGGEMGKNEIK